MLAPVDLQPVKASGVTYLASLKERLVEELARGDAGAAGAMRAALSDELIAAIRTARPGGEEAAALKSALSAEGRWSPYLEVGLGPDAEIFTKCAPLASVGFGAIAGVHPRSAWSNPEPELVLILNPHGDIVGASLGDDVNQRDFEGRSALLLGRAKDSRAASVIGPFIRFFDQNYTLDGARTAEITVRIAGEDGFHLAEIGSVADIARDLTDLAAQCFETSDFPDGCALYTGTPFAPTAERGGSEAGAGFTHQPGDVVEIASPRLGALAHRVDASAAAEPWRVGARALFASLAAQGFLSEGGRA